MCQSQQEKPLIPAWYFLWNRSKELWRINIHRAYRNVLPLISLSVWIGPCSHCDICKKKKSRLTFPFRLSTRKGSAYVVTQYKHLRLQRHQNAIHLHLQAGASHCGHWIKPYYASFNCWGEYSKYTHWIYAIYGVYLPTSRGVVNTLFVIRQSDTKPWNRYPTGTPFISC